MPSSDERHMPSLGENGSNSSTKDEEKSSDTDSEDITISDMIKNNDDEDVPLQLTKKSISARSNRNQATKTAVGIVKSKVTDVHVQILFCFESEN